MDTPQENLLTDFEEPEYQFVGFWQRVGARFVDSIIVRVVVYILGLFINSSGSMIIYAVVSVIPLLYHPVLEYKFGASLGKMLLRIKVVNYDMQNLTIANVVLRNILYVGLQLIAVGFTLFYVYSFQSEENSIITGIVSSFSEGISWSVFYGLAMIALVIAEIVCMLTDSKFRALHDRIGKTYVVKKIR
jgi:uncharacterized RDD family membrane protein YckC